MIEAHVNSMAIYPIHGMGSCATTGSKVVAGKPLAHDRQYAFHSWEDAPAFGEEAANALAMVPARYLDPQTISLRFPGDDHGLTANLSVAGNRGMISGWMVAYMAHEHNIHWCGHLTDFGYMNAHSHGRNGLVHLVNVADMASAGNSVNGNIYIKGLHRRALTDLAPGTHVTVGGVAFEVNGPAPCGALATPVEDGHILVGAPVTLPQAAAA